MNMRPAERARLGASLCDELADYLRSNGFAFEGAGQQSRDIEFSAVTKARRILEIMSGKEKDGQ